MPMKSFLSYEVRHLGRSASPETFCKQRDEPKQRHGRNQADPRIMHLLTSVPSLIMP